MAEAEQMGVFEAGDVYGNALKRVEQEISK